ncbi:TPA: hypothetical protein ACLEB8_004805 [Pseudomonas aeruginosa]
MTNMDPVVPVAEPAEKISACTCFNCEVWSPDASTHKEAEAVAAAEGWVIGLDPSSKEEEVNAVYACGQCANLLIDTYPVAR